MDGNGRLEALYLSRTDVESVAPPMAEVVAAVERALLEKGSGRIEMPPKIGIHPRPDSLCHAMPAWLPSLKAAGIKWVSAFPDNARRGLPQVSGLIILNDPDTGLPVCIMDCTWITAARTGAATAAAARRLARPGSETVAIVACGVQGRSNLEALKSVFPGIGLVRAFDTNRAAAELYADQMRRKLDVEVLVTGSAEEAVRGADIVVTSGPIVRNSGWRLGRSCFAEGVFISPVDLDSYLEPEVFRAAGRFYTDDSAQFAAYRKMGFFEGVPDPLGDLGELLAGRKPGRTDPREITISANLGLAIEDVAVAVAIHARAREKGVGTILPL
ncbi:MAG: ornithine cyclodeaminase family protein [Planctomycetota bacterium]|nr:ornithine cyclodeaminase family protein [Planctomycetota bacterium]